MSNMQLRSELANQRANLVPAARRTESLDELARVSTINPFAADTPWFDTGDPKKSRGDAAVVIPR